MICKVIDILSRQNITFDEVIPVGHHILNRNFVFLVKGKTPYIFKIYGKKVKFYCEKRALEIFSCFSEIPNLVSDGEEEDISWILMSAIEGDVLEDSWSSLSCKKQTELIESIGMLLGKIHMEQRDSYFGLWKEWKGYENKDFIEYRKKNDEKIMNRIKSQNLPDIKLFERAYMELIGLYSQLNANIKSAICHRDYSYRNMIVGENEKGLYLKGIIDFEHCQPDDPAIDFNTLYQYHMIYSDDMERAFFKGYEKYMPKPNDFKERKRYYMINLGLHSCSWSYTKAPDFYQRGKTLLEEIL